MEEETTKNLENYRLSSLCETIIKTGTIRTDMCQIGVK